MPLKLDEARRDQIVASLRGFYQTEFDEDISRFRAEQVTDFLLAVLGPGIYNQAVQDARGYMQQKLDDLDGEIHAIESP